MKIKIIYDNFTISSNLIKSIQVKDILKQLKISPFLNSKEEDELKLLNSDQDIMNENDYINILENLDNNQIKLDEKIKEESIKVIDITKEENKFKNLTNEKYFYLVKYQRFKNIKFSQIEDFKLNDCKKKPEIEELIMKTTNAKIKIDTSKISRGDRTTTDRLNLLDELINSSLGNILNERQDINNNENVSQFLNILRPIIGNEVDEGEIIINRDNRGPGSIIISRSGHHRVSLVPDENAVNSLQEMGFPEEQCRRSLILARNDISRATDILLNGNLDYLPYDKYYYLKFQKRKIQFQFLK